MEYLKKDAPEPTTVEHFNNDIDCLLVHDFLNLILVGDRYGRVAQYKYDLKTETIKLQKDYGNIGIRYIYSGTIMGNLAIVGGSKTSSLMMIDMVKQQIFGEQFETAVNTIQSIQLCLVSKSQILLAVCGIYSDFSDKKTDIYDASDLLVHNILNTKDYVKRMDSDAECSDTDSQKSNSSKKSKKKKKKKSKKSRSPEKCPPQNYMGNQYSYQGTQSYNFNPGFVMQPSLVKVEDYINTLFGTLLSNMEKEEAFQGGINYIYNK